MWHLEHWSDLGRVMRGGATATYTADRHSSALSRLSRVAGVGRDAGSLKVPGVREEDRPRAGRSLTAVERWDPVAGEG